MRSIDSYFHDEVDKALYHYTDIDSIVGMAETNAIWASNVYFLNDSAEIVYACDVLEGVIKPRIVFGDNDDPEIAFLNQLKNWVTACKRNTYNIFVFSLSEEPSLLSQWRSYTPHGRGVSAGFSQDSLSAIAKSSGVRIAKCLYERDEQEEIISSLIEKLLITFRRELPNIDTTKAHPTQCYHPFLEQFRGDVLQVLSIIKHREFREEKEWRLISRYYDNYTVPEIKFRKGASMLVPYVEFSLADMRPIFERVILGPSQHQNLSMSALSMFLSNKKLSHETVNCVIPYREW